MELRAEDKNNGGFWIVDFGNRADVASEEHAMLASQETISEIPLILHVAKLFNGQWFGGIKSTEKNKSIELIFLPSY